MQKNTLKIFIRLSLNPFICIFVCYFKYEYRMEIRQAKESQLLEVLYIVRECAFQLQEKGVKYWHNSHADYAEILKDILDKRVFVLLYRKMVVGTATVKQDPEGNGIMKVSRLAVLPSFQRRGFAKELLKYAVDEAKTHSAKTLRGVTPIDDTSTNQLFEQAGFAFKSTTSTSESDPPRVIFEKLL